MLNIKTIVTKNVLEELEFKIDIKNAKILLVLMIGLWPTMKTIYIIPMIKMIVLTIYPTNFF